MKDHEVCLRQVFRPKVHHHLDGCGDCTVCTPHPDNERCNMFFPITRPALTTIKAFEILMDVAEVHDD